VQKYAEPCISLNSPFCWSL